MSAIWSLIPLPFLNPAWTSGSCFTYCWSLIWAPNHVCLFATPWTVQSMEFSRPEYWIGQPIPSPVDLPDPGIKPGSSALQMCSLLTELPSLENFEHYFTSVWDEHNYVVVSTFFGTAFLWDCFFFRKLTFSSPVATSEFSKFAGILSAALKQHYLLGSEIAQLEFHHLL